MIEDGLLSAQRKPWQDGIAEAEIAAGQVARVAVLILEIEAIESAKADEKTLVLGFRGGRNRSGSRGWGRFGRRLFNLNLDPPILSLGDAIGRRHCKLILAHRLAGNHGGRHAKSG